MQEAGDSNTNVKVELKNELRSINAVVNKIKQELNKINDIVQANGSLDTTLTNTIDSLELFAQKMDIAIPKAGDDMQEDNPMTNALFRITTAFITDKLTALSHD